MLCTDLPHTVCTCNKESTKQTIDTETQHHFIFWSSTVLQHIPWTLATIAYSLVVDISMYEQWWWWCTRKAVTDPTAGGFHGPICTRIYKAFLVLERWIIEWKCVHTDRHQTVTIHAVWEAHKVNWYTEQAGGRAHGQTCTWKREHHVNKCSTWWAISNHPTQAVEIQLHKPWTMPRYGITIAHTDMQLGVHSDTHAEVWPALTSINHKSPPVFPLLGIESYAFIETIWDFPWFWDQ